MRRACVFFFLIECIELIISIPDLQLATGFAGFSQYT